jgi:DNA-binding transcriptional regulator YhcF (GntR family)
MVGDPRKREKVYQRVANTLRETVSYVYYPETEMPPAELILAAEFDVSRHTMRDALKVLEGLIECRAGRGTAICARSVMGGAWEIESLDQRVGEFDLRSVNVLYKGTFPPSSIRRPQKCSQCPKATRCFRSNASCTIGRDRRRSIPCSRSSNILSEFRAI